MGYLTSAITQANAIKDSLSDIKEAVNAKNPSIPIEDNTALANWDDCIDSIPGQFAPETYYDDTNEKFTGVCLLDEYTVPTTYGGGEVHNVFNPSIDFSHLFCCVKKLHIPAHFVSANLQPLLYNATDSTFSHATLEELQIDSVTITSWDGTGRIVKLKKLALPNYTSNEFNAGLLNVSYGITDWDFVSDHLYISMPSFRGKFNPTIGTNNKSVEVSVNLPLATALEDRGDLGDWLTYVTGTMVFPSVTIARHLCRPKGSQTIKLPSITTMDSYNCFNRGANTGTIHLYLGPNLSSLNNDQGYWTTYASQIDVHIPAGSSTTKTTLDAKGISYTQDYDYTQDLLS